MSDSVRPHRWQPIRLPCPWDSPGKSIRVGCHFLLQCVKVKSLSHVRLLVTPWTAAYQAPLSMGFSRQEYWSGVPLLSPNTLLDFIISGACQNLLQPEEGTAEQRGSELPMLRACPWLKELCKALLKKSNN